MLTPWELLIGGVLPAVVTLVIGLVAWKPWASSEVVSPSRGLVFGRAVSTVALAGAFVLAWGILFGRLNEFPPKDATSWVIFSVLMLTVWGVIDDGYVNVAPPARIAAAMLGVAVFVYLLIKPLVVSQSLESTQGASAMGGLTALTLAWWASVELLERRGLGSKQSDGTKPLLAGQNGLTSAGVLLVLTTTIAVIHGMSGSVSFAQKSGFLSAGVGGLFVVALWCVARGRPVSFSHGPVLVVVAAAGLLLATGRFYSEITWTSTGLIVLIPFTPWLAELNPVRRRFDGRPVRAAIVRIGLSAVPALVALTIAGLAFYKAMQESASDGYGGY